MIRKWLVRVPEHPAADARWEWLDASDANAEAGAGDLAALAAAISPSPGGRGQPVVALLPASAMLVVPVTVPLKQHRQLQQALPFLLEEKLAADIERFHVVAGARIDATRLQAVAVEREVLRDVLAMLGAAGIDPESVTGEAFATPGSVHESVVLLDGVASLLVAADGNVLPFDESDAAVACGALRLSPGAEVRVVVGATGSAVAAGNVESAFAGTDDPPRVNVDASGRHRLHLFAEGLAAGSRPAVNLRQGSFARAGGSAFSPGFDWRPLAWLAASWAVLALGYQLALGITYGRAADSVREAQVALYKQAFPGSGSVPKPRAQMEGQLRSAAGGAASFSSLVARTAGAMKALDGGTGRFTPRNLTWDGTRRELRVDIVARSLEDLEQLRHALEQEGLSVDIGAGVSQDGGYKARMNVGERG